MECDEALLHVAVRSGRKTHTADMSATRRGGTADLGHDK